LTNFGARRRRTGIRRRRTGNTKIAEIKPNIDIRKLCSSISKFLMGGREVVEGEDIGTIPTSTSTSPSEISGVLFVIEKLTGGIKANWGVCGMMRNDLQVSLINPTQSISIMIKRKTLRIQKFFLTRP